MGYDVASIILGCLAVIATLEIARRLFRRHPDMSGQAIQTHRIQEVVRLWHAPEMVWDLIHPPENTPLLSPEVAKGYRVPGTPAGRGEQQAFIDLSGNTYVIEVIDYIEARRAVVRYLIPQVPTSLRFTYTLEPMTDGCTLTYGQEYEGWPSQSIPAESAQQWRLHAQDYLERVRSTLSTWKPQANDEADTWSSS